MGHRAWGMGEAVRWKGSADSHASAVMGHGAWGRQCVGKALPTVTHLPSWGMGEAVRSVKRQSRICRHGALVIIISPFPFPLSLMPIAHCDRAHCDRAHCPLRACPLPNYLTTNSSHGLIFAGNSETRRNGSWGVEKDWA